MERKEVVVDVACSDGGEVDPDTNRCPDNGASVDLTIAPPHEIWVLVSWRNMDRP